MIQRLLNIKQIAAEKSFFLLGPRQTGKTTLLKSISETGWLKIDLLDPEISLKLLQHPGALTEIITAHSFGDAVWNNPKIIIVDEIQKNPTLLDVIHSIIEKDSSYRFILTGSSARKLRKTGVNLLGGRAGKVYFHPFVSRELIFKVDEALPILNKIMLIGSIPSVFTSRKPFSRLHDYVGLYLQEEIQIEAASRNLAAFSRFLKIAALTNAEQLNYEKIGNDAQVPPRTIKDYYEVLEDTLIGRRLEPYRPKPSRKIVATPKFYFFDPGVVSALVGRRELSVGTSDYGKAMEHLVYCELVAFKDYFLEEAELYYWRTQTQQEVDFVFVTGSQIVAIEVKSTSQFRREHASGILALEQTASLTKKIVVNLETLKKKTHDNIVIYPLATFLKDLWLGKIIALEKEK